MPVQTTDKRKFKTNQLTGRFLVSSAASASLDSSHFCCTENHPMTHWQRIYHQARVCIAQVTMYCTLHCISSFISPIGQIFMFTKSQVVCFYKENVLQQAKGKAVKIRSAFPQIGTTKVAKNTNQHIELCVYLFLIHLFSLSLQA